MDEQIKRINERNHPALFSGQHLPILARIEAISDPVTDNALGERCRPRYAVDVQVLLPNGQPDTLLPLFRAVPLPLHAAGHERGTVGFPSPGTVVELAFAYGLPDRPFIRTILGEGLSLPSLEPGELLAQASPGVFQRADSAGNWQRTTDADIYDDCLHHVLQCYSSTVTAQEFFAQVRNNSTEQVLGVKVVEALGALKLLSAGTLNMTAVDNLNITTASDQNNKVGRDVKQRVGNIVDSLAVAKQLIRVKNGGKVWLGSEAENVLQILSELIQVVADIANTAASHNHPYTDNGNPMTTSPPNQQGVFNGQKGSADELKGRLDPIVE